jgi:nitrous oxidase accessory protein NosD
VWRSRNADKQVKEKGIGVRRRLQAFTIGAIVAAMLMASFIATAQVSATTIQSVLYVSPAATSESVDVSCLTARYHTISAAVEAARSGDTILVCPGTYREEVRLTKSITVRGLDQPVIDGSGFDSAVAMTASHATIAGFTIDKAFGEGVLATSVRHITIEDNFVEDNDRGAGSPRYKECMAYQGVPGDCGEGIHLSGVVDSKVLDNEVRANSGGILISDERGPTHGDLVKGNIVIDNTADCGITVASHRTDAVNARDVTRPRTAGVFSNTITDNTVADNGTTGEGAGILLAAEYRGGAVYGNVVSRNTVIDSGLAGVTINENAMDQDLSGNVVEDNIVGANNLGGDKSAGDVVTTGVLVFAHSRSARVHVRVTGNVISDDTYGIFVLTRVTLTQSGNTFYDVRVRSHVES